MERNIKNTGTRVRAAGLLITIITVAFGLGACGGGGESGGTFLGRKELPSGAVLATNSEPLTIAVHYVAFPDANGAPVVDEGTARATVEQMSRPWSACGISFRLENFEMVSPATLNVPQGPANYSELDRIRTSLQNDTQLLMVATGTWNRSGSLGDSGSNCFSSFPGDEADGIVCESKVGKNVALASHEVGHWLNLIHTDAPGADLVDDTNANNRATNLMEHVVSPANIELTPGQCARARQAIGDNRAHAVVQQ